jgi:hypothetical protein
MKQEDRDFLLTSEGGNMDIVELKWLAALRI